MSYCRFSSDNWASDVYVYESGTGYQIEVAGSKHVGDSPCPVADVFADNFPEQYLAQQTWLESAKLVPIGLSFDGDSYTLPTPTECADRLLELRAAGYHVPQFAIDNLRMEALESMDGGQ